jgi:hypothetical protein
MHVAAHAGIGPVPGQVADHSSVEAMRAEWSSADLPVGC